MRGSIDTECFLPILGARPWYSGVSGHMRALYTQTEAEFAN